MTEDVIRSLKDLRALTPLPAAHARRRKPPYMTGAEVAQAAGIDRSRYVGLENGTHELTEHYARKLEPVLGIRVWELVVAPQPEGARGDVNEVSYLAHLQQLRAEMLAGRQRFDSFVEATTARLGVLEAALAKPSPQSGRRRGGEPSQKKRP